MTFLLISALILGALAFYEPCTIASHTLFSVRLHQADNRTRLRNLLHFWFWRSVLVIGLLWLADLVIGQLQLSEFQSALALLGMALVYLISRYRYLPIPNLAPLAFLGTRLPPPMQLGLTLPTCTLPLLMVVAGLSLSSRLSADWLYASLIFTSAQTLPLIWQVWRGLGDEQKALLREAGENTPLVTALLLIMSAAVLLAIGWGINLAELKAVLAEPTLHGLWLGFLAGFIFSFNPVAIASIPVVLAYVTRSHEPQRAIRYGSAFVLGMVITHVGLGVAAALGGGWVQSVMGRWWGLILGPLLIALGMIWLGWIRFRLPWFSMRGQKVSGSVGAFLLGIPFSVAICPFCTPALIIMLAASAAIASPGFGFTLLLAFALGRAVPIILGAISMAWLESLTMLNRSQRYFETIGGIILIITGLYLLNEYFYLVAI